MWRFWICGKFSTIGKEVSMKDIWFDTPFGRVIGGIYMEEIRIIYDPLLKEAVQTDDESSYIWLYANIEHGQYVHAQYVISAMKGAIERIRNARHEDQVDPGNNPGSNPEHVPDHRHSR